MAQDPALKATFRSGRRRTRCAAATAAGPSSSAHGAATADRATTHAVSAQVNDRWSWPVRISNSACSPRKNTPNVRAILHHAGRSPTLTSATTIVPAATTRTAVT